MLPLLNQDHHQERTDAPQVISYLDQLKKTDFSGDIERSYASRLIVATDNSVYQCVPEAVLFPRTTHDLVLLCQLSNESEYKDIRFSPRGGGTGTNGQSLSKHLIIDLSRYMTQIIEINIEEAWVRVQAGVVKDALNDALRPHGFFFSPDLSTSNRATIGGMINTDASGQGSLKYGKTSDHVLSVTAILADGSVLNTQAMTKQEIDALTAKNNATDALKRVAEICCHQRKEIEAVFPPLNRFLTGYDLKNAYQPDNERIDIGRIICGSEGSLAFVSEAKLNITAIPTKRLLINVKYDTFDSALKNAPLLVEAHALSVETMDSRVLNLAKKDIVWLGVKDYFSEVPNKNMQGVNLVEFAGADETETKEGAHALCERLDALMLEEGAGIIGYQVCEDVPSIERIYGMRKKAVGLLGATKGHAKPVAFVEDTCVPPEKLADFIIEFRALLDSHGLDYGMFGHVDAGVLHVRPALDLCCPEQARLIKPLSDKVVTLVAKYGGLMWGEHGKGFRSEYTPAFFGETLYQSLREIKGAFDPQNKMNPGKICTPIGSNEDLACVSSATRGEFDRQIPVKTRNDFHRAMDCNGNGLCFNYDVHSPMCPSMKVSSDRIQSPKGRAGMMREWLRLLAVVGVSPLSLEKSLMEKNLTFKQCIQRLQNHWDEQNKTDFSHEVMEAMKGCLACKACATQCPINVDVPQFRARFMNLYYSRYPRPLKDYLVANIETLLPVMVKWPRVANAFIAPVWAQYLTEKILGYVNAPVLSVPPLQTCLKDHGATRFDFLQLQTLTQEERKQHVLIVQDPFTSFYEADLLVDLVHLVESLGKKPILLPFKPNGKAQHVKGFLRQFSKTADNTAQCLSQLAALGIPMMGIDPAMVLCYRDEYAEILGASRGDFHVQLVHEWLLNEIKNKPDRVSFDPTPWYLLAHCTEKTKLPNVQNEWKQIFNRFGLLLDAVPVGCCGMAGTYGHETEHLKNSKGIYALSWKSRLETLPMSRCMATGYSCRSQVKRFEKTRLLHPVQVLLRYIQNNGRCTPASGE